MVYLLDGFDKYVIISSTITGLLTSSSWRDHNYLGTLTKYFSDMAAGTNTAATAQPRARKRMNA